MANHHHGRCDRRSIFQEILLAALAVVQSERSDHSANAL